MKRKRPISLNRNDLLSLDEEAFIKWEFISWELEVACYLRHVAGQYHSPLNKWVNVSPDLN